MPETRFSHKGSSEKIDTIAMDLELSESEIDIASDVTKLAE